MRNTPHLLAAVAALTFAAAACAPADDETSDDLHSAASELATLDDANSPSAPNVDCRGTLIRGAPLLLPLSGRELQQWLCIDHDNSPDRVAVYWVDEGGALTDLRAARAEEARVMRDNFSRMALDLVEDLATRGAKEAVEVDIWPKVVEPTPPDRQLIIDSVTIREQYYANLRMTYAAAFDQLTARIRAVAPTASVVRHDQEEKKPALAPVPFVTVTANPDILRVLGKLDDVLRITKSVNLEAGRDEPHSTAYLQIDGIPTLQGAGYDGDGITVAMLEGNRFDSAANLSLPGGGDCNTVGASNYKCACPADNTGSHPRWTAGVVANTLSSLSYGTARNATVLNANWDNAYGCSFTDAVQWATGYGQYATVINRSGSTNGGGSAAQPAMNLYMDYTAAYYPYPLFVASAGNSVTAIVNNRLANGLVVGGAEENRDSNRNHLKAMWYDSSGLNVNGAYGWEFPHLVAPAGAISTADDVAGRTVSFNATSAAAPQVAGVAASLQEEQSLIKYFPQAAMAILLAATEQDVAGVWPLSLQDSTDDMDGVGAVHGAYALAIAGNKVDGGNPPAGHGFDRGLLSVYTTPSFTYYSEVYNAGVAPGQTLRVALVSQGHVACSNPDSQGSCTATNWADLLLLIKDSQGSILASSSNFNGNYQYATWTNNTGGVRFVAIRFLPLYYNGLTYTNFGLAWGAAG